jgi:L-asparaginase II
VTRFDGSFEPIVVTTRSDFEESLHYGAGVVIDASGDVVASVGDPDLVVYPRSSLKPLQAITMVDLGLDLPADLLAVVCASHDGAPMHLEAVCQILERFGLDESDLGNTPSRPMDNAERSTARAAGIGPSSLQQNCSGKHAGMLATCRINAWPLTNYLDEDHPLQQAITVKLADFGCTVHQIGIDGCGAPTHALELSALAGAFGVIASSGSTVAQAMMSRPDLVGGSTRDVTIWMQAIPGLMIKDGAAGVMAAALSDGRACAYKIADGSGAARQAVIVEALRAMDVDLDLVVPETIDRLEVEVRGGGRTVGSLVPLAWAR